MKRFRTPWFWWCVGAGLTVIALIWTAYWFNWPGTGFQNKKVWDWLQLLIIPAALALVALLFNQANARTERHIALDKQREDLLQAYLDRMSELLLGNGLRTSQDGTEVRNVARTRTISVLRQLDARRVGDVVVFLREGGLADTTDPILSLKSAGFFQVKWSGAPLRKANLRGALLYGADLSQADLRRALLYRTDLRGADLREANLRGALLSEADLRGADLRGADLSQADLSKANLSKACLHDTRFHKVNLHGANLHQANLFRVNLSGADLREVDLSGALLIDADLSGANLFRVNLSGTDLTADSVHGVNVHGPNLRGASLYGAVLKGAKIAKSQLTPEQIAQAIWDEEAEN